MTHADDALVVAAVAGDEGALTSLLERYGVEIREELSIGSKWQAQLDRDDVMQVTYLEAFLGIGKLSHPTATGFVAWLRCIAGNNLRDAIRMLECDKRPQNRVAPVNSDDSYAALLEQISAGSSTPSRVAGRLEVQRFVEDAIRKLPEDYEKVIRLCELDSKTAPEAATILGRSHGAVRMLLLRAKDHLREILNNGPALLSDTA